jgi:hypothetical protein
MGYGMEGHTSPSAVSYPDGSYTIAFQANTGTLWAPSLGTSINIGDAMNTATSPSSTD